MKETTDNKKTVDLYMVGTEGCYFDLETLYVTNKQYQQIKQYIGDGIEYLDDMRIPGLIRKCDQLLKEQYEMAEQEGQENIIYHILASIEDDD